MRHLKTEKEKEKSPSTRKKMFVKVSPFVFLGPIFDLRNASEYTFPVFVSIIRRIWRMSKKRPKMI